MLIIGFNKIGKTYMAEKYSDHVRELKIEDYQFNPDGTLNSSWPVNCLESIKGSIAKVDITIINYNASLINFLDGLKIKYICVYPSIEYMKYFESYLDNYKDFENLKCEKLYLQDNQYLEDILRDKYEWIETIPTEISLQEENAITVRPDANNLKLEDLIRDDIQITESDVRELKTVQNKLRVGLLLQAKSNLNRVLKLSTVLDKLQDELVNRITDSITLTDTPSLIYTTELISKLLADTNNFIVNVLSNEKIQNFFIIDNVNVTNINPDKADVNERERIRKAVEIVLGNVDYFESGEFSKMQNPNIIEVSEENINVDSSTESV